MPNKHTGSPRGELNKQTSGEWARQQGDGEGGSQVWEQGKGGGCVGVVNVQRRGVGLHEW